MSSTVVPGEGFGSRFASQLDPVATASDSAICGTVFECHELPPSVLSSTVSVAVLWYSHPTSPGVVSTAQYLLPAVSEALEESGTQTGDWPVLSGAVRLPEPRTVDAGCPLLSGRICSVASQVEPTTHWNHP